MGCHAAVNALAAARDAVLADPGAVDAARWRGTPALTRRRACVAAPRILVTGDAAGYVEPFTGEGLGWAIATGAAAGRLAAHMRAAPDAWRAWPAQPRSSMPLRSACRASTARSTSGGVMRSAIAAQAARGMRSSGSAVAIDRRCAGIRRRLRRGARLANRSGIDERGCAAAGAGAAFYPDPGAAPPPGTAERMALWSRTARTLAARAASDALARARVDASRITHVITASCTGFESPGIDAHLIETLSLPRTCRRLNVGFMGCHAAVNALAAARDAVLADPGAAALVCCAEVSSAHFHRSSRLDQLVANTLFADGAAAAPSTRGAARAMAIAPVTRSGLRRVSAMARQRSRCVRTSARCCAGHARQASGAAGRCDRLRPRRDPNAR
ncbi:MAG: hypothetical protein ACKOTD_11730, partial [Phycisphaerales bacterium]